MQQPITPEGWTNRAAAVEKCRDHLRSIFATVERARAEISLAREVLVGYVHVEDEHAAITLIENHLSAITFDVRGTVNRLLPKEPEITPIPHPYHI